MAYYMTYGEFQSHMKAYYYRTGNRLQFPEMTEYLYNKGLLYDSISAPDLSGDYDNLTDSEFDKVVDSLPLTLTLYDGAPLAPTVECKRCFCYPTSSLYSSKSPSTYLF